MVGKPDADRFISETRDFLEGLDSRELNDDEFGQVITRVNDASTLVNNILENGPASRNTLQDLYDLNKLMGKHLTKRPKMRIAQAALATSNQTTATLATALRSAQRTPKEEGQQAPDRVHLSSAGIRSFGASGEKLDVRDVNFDINRVYVTFAEELSGFTKIAELARGIKMGTLKLTIKTSVNSGASLTPRAFILPGAFDNISPPVLEVGKGFTFEYKRKESTEFDGMPKIKEMFVIPDNMPEKLLPAIVRKFRSMPSPKPAQRQRSEQEEINDRLDFLR